MADDVGPFAIGTTERVDGAFVRQASRFRNWVSADPAAQFTLAADRYHLYVARACPWAHRTLIGRSLMGLEDAIGVSFVDPIRDERGWAFTDQEHYADPLNGFQLLADVYHAADPGYDARVSVPVLWDSELQTIVNNESADILRMLSTVFRPLATHPVELYPAALADQIDELNARIYEHVNNGVYRAGFATKQAAYERAVLELFAMLDELDLRLSGTRFLFGREPLESDWRLFTTLIRFDAVYQIHFNCSIRKITEYPNLWPYLRDLYQWPGIADTVSFNEIRDHYYRTHGMINPAGIVAVMPAMDLGAPHHRHRM